MVDDLLRRNILRGKAEADVFKLLGEPMVMKRSNQETMIYYTLSPQEVYPAKSWLYPGFFGTFDNWTLEIVLSNNIFASAKVGQ